ncbi:MAG: hypothetical protein ACLPX5_00135 [Dissulfurispiraceae bacterium]
MAENIVETQVCLFAGSNRFLWKMALALLRESCDERRFLPDLQWTGKAPTDWKAGNPPASCIWAFL